MHHITYIHGNTNHIHPQKPKPRHQSIVQVKRVYVYKFESTHLGTDSIPTKGKGGRRKGNALFCSCLPVLFLFLFFVAFVWGFLVYILVLQEEVSFSLVLGEEEEARGRTNGKEDCWLLSRPSRFCITGSLYLIFYIPRQAVVRPSP